MVLGLTFLTEPNLSLATTRQVDDLKKKSSKKKNLTLDHMVKGLPPSPYNFTDPTYPITIYQKNTKNNLPVALR